VLWGFKFFAFFKGYGNAIYAQVIPVPNHFLGQHNPKKVRMLEVTGDFMSKIHLNSGDLVFFIDDDSQSDGCLYVIGIDDKLFVKKLEFDVLQHEIRIISENDRYETKIEKGEDMNRLRITGKVIAWITRHPY